MKRNRSMVAIFIVGLMSLGGAGPARAEQGTRCTFEFEITFSPGLSVSPSSGTHRSAGPGTLQCEGLVNTKQPTGGGTLEEHGRYGIQGPDTCQGGGEADGVDILKLPTANGVETVVSEFTATFGDRLPTRGGIGGGAFKGTHFTGSFDFTPIEGDCITAPLTKARVFGDGVIHG